VLYLHHTKDKDEDVVFFFSEPQAAAGQSMQTSPIAGIYKMTAVTVEEEVYGKQGEYLLVTQHTDYIVSMPLAKAEHLARELGLPLLNIPENKGKRRVTYLHHTRDADGDVVLHFVDPTKNSPERMQTSPVQRVKPIPSPVIDLTKRGPLGRYLITTQNTDYEVQMPRAAAEHLIIELGVPLQEVLEKAQRATGETERPKREKGLS
jgi:hypothetical protein